MNKETKRYSLVEYCGTQIRYVKSKNEYYKILDTINKYNNRKTSEFFYGNLKYIELDNGLYKVIINVYNKLTEKMTISELDELTCNYEREYDLINAFKDKLRTKSGFTPDIHIMYFENKNEKDKDENDYDRRVKYLKILYKKDKDNVTKEYIDNVIYQESKEKNILFFQELLNEFCFNPIVGEEIEKIRKYINECEIEKNDDIIAENFACICYFSKQLFHKLIRERESNKDNKRDNKNYKEKISRRRLRDFYTFTKNYDVPYELRQLPTKYNQRLNCYQREYIEKINLKEEEKQLEKILKR